MSSSNDYHFITYWRVPGTVDEVAAVLADERELPRWWPSVYLNVERLAEGDERGNSRSSASTAATSSTVPGTRQ
jgi:hypothetical protein